MGSVGAGFVVADDLITVARVAVEAVGSLSDVVVELGFGYPFA